MHQNVLTPQSFAYKSTLYLFFFPKKCLPDVAFISSALLIVMHFQSEETILSKPEYRVFLMLGCCLHRSEMNTWYLGTIFPHLTLILSAQDCIRSSTGNPGGLLMQMC